MDISERKQREAKIRYLSDYDSLTGLQNRRCYEETRALTDTPENLPLSVIVADINWLKMTNDVFGHAAGDELIQKASDILKKICRPGDTIARVGGDEFIILLPGTSAEDAANILSGIKTRSPVHGWPRSSAVSPQALPQKTALNRPWTKSCWTRKAPCIKIKH